MCESQQTLAPSPSPANAAGEPLAFFAGLDSQNKPLTLDLANRATAHLLVHGDNTEAFLQTLLASLLRKNTPRSLQITLVAEEKSALSKAPDNPFLLHPVLHSPRAAIECLREAADEIELRHELVAKHDGCLEIPAHVLVFAEVYRLYEQTNVGWQQFERHAGKILSWGGAAGIHLILATCWKPKEFLPVPLRAEFPLKVKLSGHGPVSEASFTTSPPQETLLPLVSGDEYRAAWMQDDRGLRQGSGSSGIGPA